MTGTRPDAGRAPVDQFDIVREYYQAINDGDVERAAAAYDEGCVTEHVWVGDDAGVVRGREANRDRLERFVAAFEGAFDDGAHFRVRTIAGIETGWGWVQADWQQRERSRATGAVISLRGYSHFLIEDGCIRRHRSVSAPAAETGEPPVDPPPSSRSYPPRPVVGVGAVVLVSASDCALIGHAPPLPFAQGVVLIRRRFEPLAGQWSLPGGTLEVGETLESGVAREIAEETGLTARVGPVIEVFDRILLDHDRRVRYHFVLIDYLCRPAGGRLCHGSDASDVTIADPSALGAYDLTAKAESVIHRALQMT